MRKPQSLDSGGLSVYIGFLAREGLVHRMNGGSGFLAGHSASARLSNTSGAPTSVFPQAEGFFSVKKNNSAPAAVDPLDLCNYRDHLTATARAQPDGQAECETLLTTGWPVWLLLLTNVAILLGVLLLSLRSRTSNRSAVTRHASVAPDTRTDCDSARFVPPQPRQHRWASASEPHASWFESAILAQVDISDAARQKLSSIGLDMFLLTACSHHDITRAAAHYALTIEQYVMLVERTVRRRLQHPAFAHQRSILLQVQREYPAPVFKPHDHEHLERAVACRIALRAALLELEISSAEQLRHLCRSIGSRRLARHMGVTPPEIWKALEYVRSLEDVRRAGQPPTRPCPEDWDDETTAMLNAIGSGCYTAMLQERYTPANLLRLTQPDLRRLGLKPVHAAKVERGLSCFHQPPLRRRVPRGEAVPQPFFAQRPSNVSAGTAQAVLLASMLSPVVASNATGGSADASLLETSLEAWFTACRFAAGQIPIMLLWGWNSVAALVQLFLRLNFRDPGVWLAIATPLVVIWLGSRLLRFLVRSPRVQQTLQHPVVRLSLRPFAWARTVWLTLPAVTELPPAASGTVADPAEPSTPMVRRAHLEAPMAAAAYAAYPATPAQTPGANRRLDWLEQPVATPSSAVAMSSYPATQVFTQIDLLARKLWQGGHIPAEN